MSVGGLPPQNGARPTSRGRSLAALGAPKRSRARGHLRAASIAERTRASMFGRFAHAACLALGGRRLPLPHSFSIMFIRSPRAAVGRHAPSVSLRPTLVRHDILLPQEPRRYNKPAVLQNGTDQQQLACIRQRSDLKSLKVSSRGVVAEYSEYMDRAHQAALWTSPSSQSHPTLVSADCPTQYTGQTLSSPVCARRDTLERRRKTHGETRPLRPPCLTQLV